MDGMAALALVFRTCLSHLIHLSKQWPAEAATMSKQWTAESATMSKQWTAEAATCMNAQSPVTAVQLPGHAQSPVTTAQKLCHTTRSSGPWSSNRECVANVSAQRWLPGRFRKKKPGSRTSWGTFGGLQKLSFWNCTMMSGTVASITSRASVSWWIPLMA